MGTDENNIEESSETKKSPEESSKNMEDLPASSAKPNGRSHSIGKKPRIPLESKEQPPSRIPRRHSKSPGKEKTSSKKENNKLKKESDNTKSTEGIKAPEPKIKDEKGSKKNKQTKDETDEISRKYRVGRSISLTPSARSVPDDDDLDGRTTPSPRPHIKRSPRPSVRSRKEQFEKENRHHKNVKEITKESQRVKRTCKTPNPSPDPEKKDAEPTKEEDPVLAMMKKLSADFQSVKTEIKDNSTKIDKIMDKIDQLERNSIRNETETKNELTKIRKDIADNKNEMEEKLDELKETNKNIEAQITQNIVNQINPQLENLKNSQPIDIRRIVKEELLLLNFAAENKKEKEKHEDEVETGEKKKKKKKKRKKGGKRGKKKKKKKKKS